MSLQAPLLTARPTSQNPITNRQNQVSTLHFFLFRYCYTRMYITIGKKRSVAAFISLWHIKKQNNWWLSTWCLTVPILLSHAGGQSEAPEPVWLHWGGQHASRIGRRHHEAMEGYRRAGLFWKSCWVPAERLRWIVSTTLNRDSNTYKGSFAPEDVVRPSVFHFECCIQLLCFGQFQYFSRCIIQASLKERLTFVPQLLERNGQNLQTRLSPYGAGCAEISSQDYWYHWRTVLLQRALLQVCFTRLKWLKQLLCIYVKIENLKNSRPKM